MTVFIETQLALLGQQMESLRQTAKETSDEQKNSNAIFTEFRMKQVSMENDVKLIKDQLASNAPTIQEFITIKHKVQGAGWMGKTLWAVGGALIAFVAAARKEIFSLAGGN